jgi:hypothetical protein
VSQTLLHKLAHKNRFLLPVFWGFFFQTKFEEKNSDCDYEFLFLVLDVINLFKAI